MYDRLIALAEKAEQVTGQIETEEATKTALVLPLIQILGYDVFNPAEVVPEFTADVGIKRGEKVDYAICRDGQPIMLFECKPVGAKLESYSSQLYRYFSTTDARLAVLTDGVRYRFFSDLHDRNRLDDTPFFSFSLDRIRKDDAERLEQFAKAAFDLDQVLVEAEGMKCRAAIRSHFAREFADPSDRFVRHFVDEIHDGRLTQGVLDRYRAMVKAALGDYLASAVERRLQSALQASPAPAEMAAPVDDSAPADADDTTSATEESENDRGVETTVEELQGLYVVKAILREVVDPRRVIGRDVRSYFGVLLDDNNRRPICRLRFNRAKKYVGVFNEMKAETRLPIDDIDGLFAHADAIKASLAHVLTP